MISEIAQYGDTALSLLLFIVIMPQLSTLKADVKNIKDDIKEWKNQK